MFLKERDSGHLVEVVVFDELIDPNRNRIQGKYQIGEADQDEEAFAKSDLIFMSGEELPDCWLH